MKKKSFENFSKVVRNMTEEHLGNGYKVTLDDVNKVNVKTNLKKW